MKCAQLLLLFDACHHVCRCKLELFDTSVLSFAVWICFRVLDLFRPSFCCAIWILSRLRVAIYFGFLHIEWILSLCEMIWRCCSLVLLAGVILTELTSELGNIEALFLLIMLSSKLAMLSSSVFLCWILALQDVVIYSGGKRLASNVRGSFLIVINFFKFIDLCWNCLRLCKGGYDGCRLGLEDPWRHAGVRLLISISIEFIDWSTGS